MLWDLFWTFFKIGLISFGGGYAMIPVVEHETAAHGWLSVQDFSDAVAVAGMSPGPIATNTAVFIGYKTEGIPGAAAAAAGIILPSLLIIVAAAAFFYRVHHVKAVKAVFYGLKPVITGLILYAAVHYAMVNGMVGAPDWRTVSALGIFALSAFAMLRYRVHPLYVILLSGVAGAAFYD